MYYRVNYIKLIEQSNLLNQTPYYIEVTCLFRYTYIGRVTKMIFKCYLVIRATRVRTTLRKYPSAEDC